MEYIPLPRGAYERECYNLANLFANNFTNISNPTEPHPGVPNSGSARANDPNRLNVTALNRAAYDVQANYSRIWYQQTNESMYGTTAPGEMAARLLNIYPERDCKQGKGNPPLEIGLVPFYSWNCQSEASGECYSTPEEIQSFGISSAALFQETYGGSCWAMEARGAASELQPARLLAAGVGFSVAVALVL